MALIMMFNISTYPDHATLVKRIQLKITKHKTNEPEVK